jgi:hypothetical protein
MVKAKKLKKAEEREKRKIDEAKKGKNYCHLTFVFGLTCTFDTLHKVSHEHFHVTLSMKKIIILIKAEEMCLQ